MAKYVLGFIPVASFGLGVWQVKRWRWKLQLIDEMEKKIGADPVEFPLDNLEELSDLEYRKVRLHGKFDFTKEIIMGPRSLISSKNIAESKGLISNPKTGYHIVTPFKVTGEPLTILVNRGWIPSKNYKQFNAPYMSAEQEIIGVVRKPEKRAPFVAKNIAGEKGLWFFRDVPKMAEYLGTAEAFLDLSATPRLNVNHPQQDSTTPVPGQTRVTLRNDHVTYFFTWFTLSFLTTFMWHRLYILKKTLR